MLAGKFQSIRESVSFYDIGPDATQNEAYEVVQRQPCISTGGHATGEIVEGGGDMMSAIIGKQAKKQSWELKPRVGGARGGRVGGGGVVG